MSNPNMETKIKELLELKRMKEELEAEITSMEDEIKSIMGEEETLLAGAFKVTWTPYTWMLGRCIEVARKMHKRCIVLNRDLQVHQWRRPLAVIDDVLISQALQIALSNHDIHMPHNPRQAVHI